jgi:hypothetical protein
VFKRVKEAVAKTEENKAEKIVHRLVNNLGKWKIIDTKPIEIITPL